MKSSCIYLLLLVFLLLHTPTSTRYFQVQPEPQPQPQPQLHHEQPRTLTPSNVHEPEPEPVPEPVPVLVPVLVPVPPPQAHEPEPPPQAQEPEPPPQAEPVPEPVPVPVPPPQAHEPEPHPLPLPQPPPQPHPAPLPHPTPQPLPQPAPEFKGSNADRVFIIFVVTLIFFMIPGTAFFYAGLVDDRNVANTIFLAIMAAAMVGFQWPLWGFSFSFANSNPYFGDTGFYFGVDSMKFMADTMQRFKGITLTVGFLLEMAYAMVGAALLSGAAVLRMRIHAWAIFVLLWTTLVYDVVAHWLWSEPGWLRVSSTGELRAMDFAGGIAIHMVTGFSGITLCTILGPIYSRKNRPPHSITLSYIGTSMLWIGWMGFNGGGASAPTDQAASAVVNTFVGGFIGFVTWYLLESVIGRTHLKDNEFVRWHPRVEPTGAILGLVAITPGAGFVNSTGAFFIGSVTPILTYLTKFLVTNILPCASCNAILAGDILEVFWYHGFAGLVGSFLTPVCQIFSDPGAGLRLGWQCVAILLGIVVSVVGTFICAFITHIIVWIFDVLFYCVDRSSTFDERTVNKERMIEMKTSFFPLFHSLRYPYSKETKNLDKYVHLDAAYQFKNIILTKKKEKHEDSPLLRLTNEEVF